LLAFAAQNRQGAPATAGGPAAASNPDCPRTAECPLNAVTPATATTLSAGDLSFAIEEERMAHDIYVAAAAKWNLRVFANIAEAEIRHETALTALAATQGFALPLAQPGVYASADLQQLHDQLITLVNESETGALRAGALVEETDIADLRRLASLATDDASRAVLANLERASLQHLSVFIRNLAVRGITYQPQVLTVEEFTALVPAMSGQGGRGTGGGRGFRGGR
jgi:hypothetical protein